MKYILLVSIAIISLFPRTVNAQIAISGKKYEFIDLKDTAVLKVKDYRGSIQWQKSNDGVNWYNVEGATKDSLVFQPNAESAYRAAIKEGNCEVIYSDTTILKPMDLKMESISIIDTIFPEILTSFIQQEIDNAQSRPDYYEYLGELFLSVNALKDSINKYTSIDTFQQAIINFQTAQNSLKSVQTGECTELNLGLGYSKGLSVNSGAKVGVAMLVALQLGAQGGGGCEIVYDIINQTRQVYEFTLCGLTGELGASLGGGVGFEANLGVSGYIKYLFNIPYYGQNSPNRFEGLSGGAQIGLTGDIKAGLGININASLGYEYELEGSCSGISNLLECPFNANAKRRDGIWGLMATVGAGGSVGAALKLQTALALELSATCSHGVYDENGSVSGYKNFRGSNKDRMLAAYDLAADIISPQVESGLVAIKSSFDMVAAAAAIIYGHENYEDCPPITLATVITEQPTEIKSNTAKITGSVLFDGGTPFLQTGICFNKTGNPTTMDYVIKSNVVLGKIIADLPGLEPNTKYYAQAYVTNKVGTVYGNEVSFTTSTNGGPGYSSFTDTRDGKVYKTVKIGDQTWMAENLAYLPSVSPSSQVSGTTPYYYVYDYEGTDVAAAKQQSNYSTYGVLYNWPAAMAGAASSNANPSKVQGVCPSGWHLPSDAEWTQLENFLIANGYNYDGTTTGNKIAKSMAATTNWNTYSGTGTIGNNLSLNNKSGFSALPGGTRYASNGSFLSVGNGGYWWSSTELNSSGAWSRYLLYFYATVSRSSFNKAYGFSVRCVRD